MTYVLYVEDCSFDAELALESLGRCAPEVSIVRAVDGAEALKRMLGSPEDGSAVNRPDLVVLDLKLPKLDGFEVLRAMRETPDLVDVPVVIATGSREERDLVQGWSLGVNAFLEKPVDLAGLIARLRAEGLLPGGEATR